MKKMSGVVFLTVLVGISTMFIGCSKKEAVIAEPKDTTFGTYPADYGIAYFNMLGITPAPTVRDLFGPHAKFVTSFQGMPAVITLEKATGTAKEFTGQLLLTLNVPEKGDMKTMRMVVTFESDDLSEMSYCRYVNFVNLIAGSKTEKRSTRSQNSDVETLGFLVGVMVEGAFWDESMLNGI
ncbi:MAG: hypothetical protein LBN21_11210 [Treponema sp.]|jgi:hypothetical protein|nr:hypothetical protein [Treponema sp.]